MSAAERVEAVARRLDARLFDGGRRQLAARHLFSALSHLEQLAVMAAERGDGIEGQLEDELVHRDAFARVAERLGGLVPETRETQAIVGYVAGLRGDMSLAVLNLTAEGWLANTFAHLMAEGFSPYLLASIRDDEVRHSTAALELARPEPEAAEIHVRVLEEMIAALAWSPGWILPLRELIGVEAIGRMGLGAVEAHRRACRHLGVEPDKGAKAIETGCRAALMRHGAEPQPVPMGPWQRSKQRLWSGPAPIACWKRLGTPSDDPARIEALVVRAVGHALDYQPSLRVTLRGGQLYQPAEVIVGVRRIYDAASRGIVTLYTRAPHKRSPERVEAELRRRLATVREAPYEELPDVAGLEPLLPVPECAVIVSQCAPYGIENGLTALVPLEGAAASVGIGAAESGRVYVSAVADHRVWDAYEMGRLLHVIEQRLAEE